MAKNIIDLGNFSVFGPVLGVLVVGLFPLFAFGQLLWIFVCLGELKLVDF